MGPVSPVTLVAASVRRERGRAGLSLSELARRAHVAKSTLSQLESGTGNPSIETLWALAVALGVPFSRLVDASPAPVRVIRAGEGPTLFADHASYAATLLAPCPPNARRDVYRVTAQPGEPRVSDAHLAGTIEHVLMSSGRARVGPAEEPLEIGAGDYACYPGDRPHLFEALTSVTTAVLVMEQR